MRAAIVVLAGTEGHENRARITNALETAKEFKDAGDEIQVIFDGAGTQWIEELEKESSDMHEIYSAVSEDSKACSFCASAFDTGTGNIVEAGGNGGHPSFRELVGEGYEIITF